MGGSCKTCVVSVAVGQPHCGLCCRVPTLSTFSAWPPHLSSFAILVLLSRHGETPFQSAQAGETQRYIADKTRTHARVHTTAYAVRSCHEHHTSSHPPVLPTRITALLSVLIAYLCPWLLIRHPCDCVCLSSPSAYLCVALLLWAPYRGQPSQCISMLTEVRSTRARLLLFSFSLLPLPLPRLTVSLTATCVRAPFESGIGPHQAPSPPKPVLQRRRSYITEM